MDAFKKNNPERLKIPFEIIQHVWAIVSTPMVFEKNLYVFGMTAEGIKNFYRGKITMENVLKVVKTTNLPCDLTTKAIFNRIYSQFTNF